MIHLIFAFVYDKFDYFLFRTDLEEVTIDSNASWYPVSVKQEVKQEDTEPNACASGGPPPKRMKSVDSAIASPMSISNPSTPSSFKPPTPASCNSSVSGQGPKTPQSMTSVSTSSSDPKFAVPSPVNMAMTPSSQPNLVRLQSVPIPSSSRSDGPCHLAPQGMFFTFYRYSVDSVYVLHEE